MQSVVEVGLSEPEEGSREKPSMVERKVIRAEYPPVSLLVTLFHASPFTFPYEIIDAAPN